MNRLKHLTGHRNITHTLWPTIGLYVGYVTTKSVSLKYLLLSLVVCHLVHLFADCKFITTDPKTGRKLHEPVAIDVNEIS